MSIIIDLQRPREPFGEDVREYVVAFLVALAVAFLYLANALAPQVASQELASSEADSQDATQLIEQRLLEPDFLAGHSLAEILSFALVLLFFLGTSALIYVAQRLARGEFHYAYVQASQRQRPELRTPPVDRRLPYLETTLLFLVVATVLGALASLAVESTGSSWFLMLNWGVAAVLFWPLVKGRGLPDLRRAMGWHFGTGLLKEMSCGLLAYLAAMPVLAIGLGLTLLLSRFTENAPYHPIVDWLHDAGSGDLVVVLLLAVVWAPLVEESLFRGSFYHYLRGRLGVAPSVLLVSLVFAAIHPQGLAGIPFLATLAAVLAVTREWRDSIIASMTLHLVHNGVATLLLIVLLS